MLSRPERIARNEALFREVNERIRDVNEHMSPAAETDFLCECGDQACTHPISLTLADYERVRSEPTHFAVKPGHVAPDVERVVVEEPGFTVVEKVDPEAASVAVREDPRS
jgi:hypothetical protein